MEAIPRDAAEKLCAEIRAENQGKKFAARMQCWGCMKYAKGDPNKMCLASKDGCNLVNKRWGECGG